MKYVQLMIIAFLMIAITISGDTIRREIGRSGDKSGTSGGVTEIALTQTAVTTEVATAGSFAAERAGFSERGPEPAP